ncbi:trihelix transcription factor GTL2-like [Carya illinoinensis]|uniref:trihelix transcription factor GTL2-like n=1 Tax=Carya illinoinensis TaxID=32201 RepID=UPI001C719B95|nr:trihelix transcription factor GTL2-like [Carya illinoinensis]
MFDGVPDQFHHFIASSRTTLPLPLSFPLHAAAAAASNPSQNITFPPYDHYEPPPPNSHHHQSGLLLHPNLLQPLHHQSPTHKDDDEKENNLVSVNLDIERERSIPVQQPIDPAWTNEEVIALLRIRSSMENWFPEFTWEHLSRKLAELGFKRSAANCKEKFEEESRYFNSNINYGKSYRFFSELEELYHGNQNPDDHLGTEKIGKKMEKPSHDQGGHEDHNLGQSLEADHSRDGIGTIGEHFKDSGTETVAGKAKRKKRKRKKFEMLKGLCEKIVSKMMAQQEEMHNKLLEDLVKRDEEKVAKEEAWKKQEMDRMNRELEIMSHEQAIAGDRQATIIEFLKQIASSSFGSQYCNEERHDIQADSPKVTKSSNSYPPSTSSSLIQAPNPNPASHINNQNTVEAPQLSFAMDQGHQNSSSLSTKGNSITPTSITKTLARHQNPILNTLAPNTPEVPSTTSPTLPLSSQNPNSPNTQNKPLTPISISTQKDSPNSITNIVKDDLGKRWPRDEVLALINLRCSLYNNGEDKELGAKAPLWERISQGMLELGYKRSAKRCKEKWENINKYFRKTKDVNKKRSLDSRTCPYFHQLSTLYNQGSLVAPSEGPENHSISSTTAPENHLPLPETGLNSSQDMSSSLNSTILQGAEGEKNMV